VVENKRCDPDWPICLYDFTFKLVCPHSNTFRVGKDQFKLIESHVPEVSQAEMDAFFDQMKKIQNNARRQAMLKVQ